MQGLQELQARHNVAGFGLGARLPQQNFLLAAAGQQAYAKALRLVLDDVQVQDVPDKALRLGSRDR